MSVLANKKVCVFCGSNAGADSKTQQSLKTLAEYLVKNDDTLVYGGGRWGLWACFMKTFQKETGRLSE